MEKYKFKYELVGHVSEIVLVYLHQERLLIQHAWDDFYKYLPSYILDISTKCKQALTQWAQLNYAPEGGMLLDCEPLNLRQALQAMRDRGAAQRNSALIQQRHSGESLAVQTQSGPCDGSRLATSSVAIEIAQIAGGFDCLLESLTLRR